MDALRGGTSNAGPPGHDNERHGPDLKAIVVQKTVLSTLTQNAGGFPISYPKKQIASFPIPVSCPKSG
jgi:hypothetical protein